MDGKPIFTSRLTAILTMIGVAVGLGNVWRFPYMMGKYGGSAFLIVYLGFTLLFAIPALMSEIALGRFTRKSPIGAFRETLGKRAGTFMGYLLLITILISSSYYVVIIANLFYSFGFSTIVGFSAENMASYQTGLSNGILQFGIACGITALCLFVIYRGLHKGIEWVSKIFVPFFLIAIVFLIIKALSIDGAIEKLLLFLKPNFSSMNGESIFASLGQAFYSLGLGGTFMIVYGRYLAPEASIPRIASWTAMGDVGAALLASLFLIPVILVFGLNMTSGPTLIFETLPQLFSVMPLGRLVGAIFLFALAAVAFLSLVAALEVAMSSIREISPDMDKITILLAIGLTEFILIFPSANDPVLIGKLDLIFGSGMQIFGSGMVIIALAWSAGKSTTLNQIFGEKSSTFRNFYFHWIKWVIPIILFLVLIGYIYEQF